MKPPRPYALPLATAAVLLAFLAALLALRRTAPDHRDPAAGSVPVNAVDTRQLLLEPGAAVKALQDAWPLSPEGRIQAAAAAPKARMNVVLLGDHAVPFVGALLQDASVTMTHRLEWVDVASEMKSAGAEKLLIALARDGGADDALRRRALAKLRGRTGAPLAATLKHLLELDELPDGRDLVVKALGDIPGRETTGLLIREAAGDGPARARMAAIDVLGARLSEAGVLQALLSILAADADLYIRRAALAAAARSRAAEAVTAFRRLAEDSGAPELLRSAARNALREP